MFVIVVALLLVLTVGIVMFTDVVDDDGSLSRKTLRHALTQLVHGKRLPSRR